MSRSHQGMVVQQAGVHVCHLTWDTEGGGGIRITRDQAMG